MKIAPHRRAGFTLVEVTLALGIAVFCLVAMFGLLPIGINSDQAAMQQTAAASVARAIAADLRSTPALSGTSVVFGFAIPASGQSQAPQTLYFGADGAATGKVGDDANTPPKPQPPLYRATVSFAPPPSGQHAATSTWIFITWPALADPHAAQPPSAFTGSYEVLAALNRN